MKRRSPRPARWPGLTLAIVLAAVVVHAIPGAADAMQYDGASVEAGQWWRHLTGHLSHWSLPNLLWNAGAFGVLGAVCEARSRRRTALAVGVSAALVSGGLAVGWLPFELYRGLSGSAAALYVYLASDVARRALRRGDRAGAALGAGLGLAFAAKVLYEMLAGTPVFADLGDLAVPAPRAHALGGLAGLLAALAPPTRPLGAGPVQLGAPA